MKSLKEIFFMVGPRSKESRVFEKGQEMFADLKDATQMNTTLRFGTLLCFGAAVALFKYVFNVEFNFLLVEAVISWMLLYTLFSVALVKGGVFKTFKALNNFYFCWLFFDIIWFCMVFLLMGGLTWISLIIFTYYLSFAYFAFSPKRALAVFFEVCALCAGVAILTFFGKIPFYPFFEPAAHLYKDINYVGPTLITAVVALYFAAQWNYAFAKNLRSKRIEAAAAQEAKTSYAVRLEARTRELEEFAQNLEGKVRKRTQELQDRIYDLERFHKVTVGRELKMIELKRELKEAKNRLNQLKLGLEGQRETRAGSWPAGLEKKAKPKKKSRNNE